MKNQFVVVSDKYIPYSSILYVSVITHVEVTRLPEPRLHLKLLNSETWCLPEKFPTEEAAQAAAVALTERIHAARVGRNINDLRH